MYNKEFLYDLGQNIKMFREELNLTIVDLHKLTKISKTYLYKLEQGEKIINVAKFSTILYALNKTAMDFISLNNNIIHIYDRIDLKKERKIYESCCI